MIFDPAEDTEDWLRRLQDHTGTEANRYLLSNPGDIIVAEQLHCYLKAVKKFPTLHRHGMAYTKLALEQSSGEITARFKAKLIDGESITDLTGGLGIDSLAFSETVQKVHYVDTALQPYLLARHNHALCGATNIEHHLSSAGEALDNIPATDWMYIDPSRRNPNKRVFLLSECEPDIVGLWSRILQKVCYAMVKLSPMYDLRAIERELPGVNRIYVVSVDGEVKEILAIAGRNKNSESVRITSVCLPEDFRIDQEEVPLQTADLSRYDLVDLALHVPDAAVIKSRSTNAFGAQFGLQRLNAKTDYLIGPKKFLPAAKSYPITEILDYKPKILRKQLKGMKVHIHQRGFTLTTDVLYSKLGVEMGEDAHLFFSTVLQAGKSALIVLKTSEALRNEV